jgi:hypothetical protein
MKARFLVTTVTVMLALCVVAGDLAAQEKWKGGLRFGLNTSQFRGDNAAGWVSGPNYSVSGALHDALAGAALGAFVRHQTWEHVGIQMEVNYSQQGGDGSITGTVQMDFPGNVRYTGDINGTLRVRMDYIEVPLLLVYALPSEDRVGLTAYIGPAVGYNSRAEAQLTGEVRVRLPDGSNRISNYDERIPVGGGVERWQLAGVVGAMLEFEMTSSIIQVDGRYTFGVTTVDKSGASDIYNHTFTIGMAFMAKFQ